MKFQVTFSTVSVKFLLAATFLLIALNGMDWFLGLRYPKDIIN